jgi:hypothetical protein
VRQQRWRAAAASHGRVAVEFVAGPAAATTIGVVATNDDSISR